MKKSHAVFSFVLLTVLLTAGAAQSLSGSNTVYSDDIVNGNVKTADLADSAVTNAKLGSNAVSSAKVADNSLTGYDINESSLKLMGARHDLDLVSGTTSFSSDSLAPSYWQDADGMVHLEGNLFMGSSTALFQMPSALLPADETWIPVLCGGCTGGMGRLDIKNPNLGLNGVFSVTIQSANGGGVQTQGHVGLTGVEWRPANK